MEEEENEIPGDLPQCRKYKELSSEEKAALCTMAISGVKNGQFPHGLMTKIANSFGVARLTAQ